MWSVCEDINHDASHDTNDDVDASPRVEFSEIPFPKLLPGTQFAKRRKKVASKESSSMFKNKNLRRSRRRMAAPHKATAPNPGPHALFTGQRVPIGTRVTKLFDGVPFDGSITRYDPLHEYYHDNYDDGDSEDFTLVSPTPAPTSVSVTDHDQIIDQNPGENFVTTPFANEPPSGEKPSIFDPNSGEKQLPFEPNSGETSGQSGENIPLFSFPETHVPAAAAHVHQSYPDVPKDFWDNRYDQNIDTTPSRWDRHVV